MLMTLSISTLEYPIEFVKSIELSTIKSQAICGRVFSTIKYIKLEVFFISNLIELKLPQIVLGYHKECMLF